MSSGPTVHMTWPVGPPMSLMERLTLASWIRQGARPIVWTYEPAMCWAPYGVEIADAGQILPRESLFRFSQQTGYRPGQGIGSLTQWADQMQMELMWRYGGWYSQLDITCLRPPPEISQWWPALHGWPGAPAQSCVACSPPGQQWMHDCLRQLRQECSGATGGGPHWFRTLEILSEHIRRAGLEQCIGGSHVYLEDDVSQPYMLRAERPTRVPHYLHWSHAQSGPASDHPIDGTYYHDLLVRHGIASEQTRS